MKYQTFTNKNDLFEYLNSGIDKSGNLKKEGGFKKHYPIFYNEYIKTIFPEDIKELPFKQKLWHFLKDIYIIPKCKICGNNVSFETRKNQWGYHIYCSGDCAMHDDSVKQQVFKTKELLYGDKNYNNKEKLIDTISKRTNEEKRKISEKSKQTRLIKNDGKYFSDETINKIKETNLNKYGVESFTKTQKFKDIIVDKQYSIQTFNINHNYMITEEQLISWCLKNDFPGNKKWKFNHPIWKCYVPGQPSPYDAWYDEKYIRKAVKNMFWILNKNINENKDERFVKRHINALNSCVIENGEIVDSDNRLLEMVLSRFTIAKIASKVTAISPSECIKIFDESNVDLSKYNGIYVPMSGFGGIVEGYKRWVKKNDSINYNEKISNIESYDINKSFCDWYGWCQRDMLESIVETDKVCIVCPPFGKKYEHWVDNSENGISQNIIDNMADITFIEWYELIKKHVKAPAYIIIGPELSSNGRDVSKYGNLFKKRVGIQLWTDELYNKLKLKEYRINEGIKE